MDILAFKAEGTLSVRLVIPGTEEYCGVTVELRGLDSPEVKAVQKKHRDNVLRSGRGLKLSADKVDKNAEETLVAAIVGWTFEQGDNGEQASLGGDENPPCNEKNKMILVKSVFGKQLDEALEDEAAFIKAT